MSFLLTLLKSKVFWTVTTVLGVVACAIYWINDYANDRCEAKRKVAQVRQLEQAATIASQDAEVIDWVLEKKPEVVMVYKRIRDELQTTPLPDCTVPERSRLLWNAVNAGILPKDSGLVGGLVPAPAAPHWGDLQHEGLDAKSRRSDGDVYTDMFGTRRSSVASEEP